MSGIEQEIVAVVRTTIAAKGNATGSRLAEILRSQFPSWRPSNSGARTLRDFLSQHAPEIEVTGRAGMDVVFGTGSEPTGTEAVARTALPPPASADLWRVWVSPNSPHALAVERDAGVVTSIPRGTHPPDGKVLVEPPTAEDHRTIAVQFAEKLPADVGGRLQALANSSEALWWQAWLSELRRTIQLSQWHVFRRANFENLLRKYLREAGLRDESVEAAIKQVRDSHQERRARRVETSNPPNQSNSADKFARDVAISAVQRMSIAELRELRLPYGIILDVLASKS